MKENHPPVEVRNLCLGYGGFTVQHDINFSVQRGDIFAIIGGNGSGKSTLMRALIGLLRPRQGQVLFSGEDFWKAPPQRQEQLQRGLGVMFQGGALWSSLTLAENLGLPLTEYTRLPQRRIREIVAFKLALVGLGGLEELYPSELSGGMKKRASLARAIALDPQILIIDEPSSGLDPLTARRLDDLILELRDSLGTTILVISHELASILTIANDSIFLDPQTRTMIATGNPARARESGDPRVRHFLSRGTL